MRKNASLFNVCITVFNKCIRNYINSKRLIRFSDRYDAKKGLP